MRLKANFLYFTVRVSSQQVLLSDSVKGVCVYMQSTKVQPTESTPNYLLFRFSNNAIR